MLDKLCVALGTFFGWPPVSLSVAERKISQTGGWHSFDFVAVGKKSDNFWVNPRCAGERTGKKKHKLFRKLILTLGQE